MFVKVSMRLIASHLIHLGKKGLDNSTRYLDDIYGQNPIKQSCFTKSKHMDREGLFFLRESLANSDKPHQEKINYVLLDSVEKETVLIDYIIRSNIDQQLIIKECFVDAVNYTERVKKMVTKDNSLLIVDPA